MAAPHSSNETEPSDWLQITWPADYKRRSRTWTSREPSMNFRPDNELAISVIHIISLSFIMSVLIVNLTRSSRKARELRKRQRNVQWTSAEARDPRFLGGCWSLARNCRYSSSAGAGACLRRRSRCHEFPPSRSILSASLRSRQSKIHRLQVGITRYVSSAYFTIMFPGVTACRSADKMFESQEGGDLMVSG